MHASFLNQHSPLATGLWLQVSNFRILALFISRTRLSVIMKGWLECTIYL